jgi:hypothetical protein
MTKESRSAGGKVGFMTVELDRAGGGRQGKERGEVSSVVKKGGDPKVRRPC